MKNGTKCGAVTKVGGKYAAQYGIGGKCGVTWKAASVYTNKFVRLKLAL